MRGKMDDGVWTMTSPLTTAQQVRLRIQDRVRAGEDLRVGDGFEATFKLTQGAPFSTMYSASAFIRLATSWSATGATIDLALGLASFSGVISANSAWKTTYLWSVFSDDEIGHFTAVGGTIAGAALEAVRALMFDSLKRAKWAAPDGTEYDDTKAMDMLAKMEERMLEEIAQAPSGGIESWSEQQAYWSTEYGA